MISQSDPEESLFSLHSLLNMCELQQNLISSTNYNEFCMTNKNRQCCSAWSLPNYVAVIGGHHNCSQITVC